MAVSAALAGPGPASWLSCAVGSGITVSAAWRRVQQVLDRCQFCLSAPLSVEMVECVVMWRTVVTKSLLLFVSSTGHSERTVVHLTGNPFKCKINSDKCQRWPGHLFRTVSGDVSLRALPAVLRLPWARPLKAFALP